MHMFQNIHSFHNCNDFLLFQLQYALIQIQNYLLALVIFLVEILRFLLLFLYIEILHHYNLLMLQIVFQQFLHIFHHFLLILGNDIFLSEFFLYQNFLSLNFFFKLLTSISFVLFEGRMMAAAPIRPVNSSAA